jgi:hypothetical protein
VHIVDLPNLSAAGQARDDPGPPGAVIVLASTPRLADRVIQ